MVCTIDIQIKIEIPSVFFKSDAKSDPSSYKYIRLTINSSEFSMASKRSSCLFFSPSKSSFELISDDLFLSGTIMWRRFYFGNGSEIRNCMFKTPSSWENWLFMSKNVNIKRSCHTAHFPSEASVSTTPISCTETTQWRECTDQ